ncbi:MAG: radical SAM/SPASM domain-containing protein [Elusimicrobiota bacterium]|jgi:radical SAM protein with 4Fe4S-binding SPASM domain
MELVDLKRLSLPDGSSLGASSGEVPAYAEAKNMAPIRADDALRLHADDENLRLAQTYIQKGLRWAPLRRCAQKPAAHRQEFPSRVLLELTSRCNLRCTMCPRNILRRPEMDLPVELAMRCIDEMDRWNIDGLWIYNIGESMLHPEFRKILAYCGTKKNLGSIWLSTNGQELSEENLDALMDSSLSFINLSVNAVTEETYRRIAPTGSLQTLRSNLARLKEAKMRRKLTHRPWLRLQIIDQPQALGEIDAFLRAHADDGDILSINLLEAFSQNVATNIDHARTRDRGTIKHCRRIERGDCFIFSDGEVGFCDTDFNHELSIGNIRDRSISELWSGDIRTRFRRSNEEGRLDDIPLCSRCMDYDL